jgi:hypothetical protein
MDGVPISLDLMDHASCVYFYHGPWCDSCYYCDFRVPHGLFVAKHLGMVILFDSFSRRPS